MVKISELKAGSGNNNVEGEITEMGEPREVVTRFGKRTRVADAKLKDDSGEIQLTLWDEDVGKFSAGDKVKIENGWVSEFRGNVQLSAGKYGKITKA
jgi:replication factor A1